MLAKREHDLVAQLLADLVGREMPVVPTDLADEGDGSLTPDGIGARPHADRPEFRVAPSSPVLGAPFEVGEPPRVDE